MKNKIEQLVRDINGEDPNAAFEVRELRDILVDIVEFCGSLIDEDLDELAKDWHLGAKYIGAEIIAIVGEE